MPVSPGRQKKQKGFPVPKQAEPQRAIVSLRRQSAWAEQRAGSKHRGWHTVTMPCGRQCLPRRVTVLRAVTMPHRMLMPCRVTTSHRVMMPHRVTVPHGVTMLHTVTVSLGVMMLHRMIMTHRVTMPCRVMMPHTAMMSLGVRQWPQGRHCNSGCCTDPRHTRHGCHSPCHPRSWGNGDVQYPSARLAFLG